MPIDKGLLHLQHLPEFNCYKKITKFKFSRAAVIS